MSLEILKGSCISTFSDSSFKKVYFIILKTPESTLKDVMDDLRYQVSKIGNGVVDKKTIIFRETKEMKEYIKYLPKRNYCFWSFDKKYTLEFFLSECEYYANKNKL